MNGIVYHLKTWRTQDNSFLNGTSLQMAGHVGARAPTYYLTVNSPSLLQTKVPHRCGTSPVESHWDTSSLTLLALKR